MISQVGPSSTRVVLKHPTQVVSQVGGGSSEVQVGVLYPLMYTLVGGINVKPFAEERPK